MSTTVALDGAAGAGPRRLGGRYAIDPDRTRVTIRARGFGRQLRGAFAGVRGSIDVPGDLSGARVAVTIDAAQFRSGSARRDRMVHGPAVLDADVHPVLRFGADGMVPILESFVTHDGDRPLWALDGHLSVRGTSCPVRIAIGAARAGDGGDLHFEATTTVRRSDFDVRRRPGLLGDSVRVRISGAAMRSAG